MDNHRNSSTSFWPNADEREVLRRWQGTVVEPARMFNRLLDVLEEVEAERAALLDVAEAAQRVVDAGSGAPSKLRPLFNAIYELKTALDLLPQGEPE